MEIYIYPVNVTQIVMRSDIFAVHGASYCMYSAFSNVRTNIGNDDR